MGHNKSVRRSCERMHLVSAHARCISRALITSLCLPLAFRCLFALFWAAKSPGDVVYADKKQNDHRRGRTCNLQIFRSFCCKVVVRRVAITPGGRCGWLAYVVIYYHCTRSAIATEVQLLHFPYIDSSGSPTKIGIVLSLHSHAYMQKMTEIGGVIMKIFE